MNDKVKGLVLGLSLGVLLTGSVAYASGTQIEVYFKNLKYMFDGSEKKPTDEQGAGFIYNGTTYVPLRFVSEALGKEVGWDADTETIWVGKRPTTVVAAYKGGQVTQGELDKFLSIQQMLRPQDDATVQQKSFKETKLRQLIGYRVLAGRMTNEMKASLPAAVNEQLAGFKQSRSDLSELLAKHGLTEQDIRSYLELVIGAGKTLVGMTSEEEIKAAYDHKVQSGELMIASVRHILIGFTDAAGKERSHDDALKLAKEVQDKLVKGGDFAALAKQYSEDPGSKDNGGLYADAPVNSWVEPFKKAAMELALGKISDPVETEYGYHVIRVESRKPLPLDQVKEGLREDIGFDTHYSQFVNQELRSLIEKIDLPK